MGMLEKEFLECRIIFRFSWGMTILFPILLCVNSFAQDAPASPDRPWLGPGEQQISGDAKHFRSQD
jgi:hypothetical protein